MSKPKTYDVMVRASAEWYGTVHANSLRDAKRIAEDEFNEGNLRQCGEEVEAIVAFKQRTRTGSWSTFERRFQPIDSPEQTLWWDRKQLPAGIDPHLVWTILDCDGKLLVAPGYHFVNRLDYVVCELPWTDEDVRQPPYRYD